MKRKANPNAIIGLFFSVPVGCFLWVLIITVIVSIFLPGWR